MEIEHSPIPNQLEACDDPHQRLRIALSERLEHLSIDARHRDVLLQAAPRKWQRLGDLVLLPLDAFEQDDWPQIIAEEGSEIWSAVATAFKLNRVGRQQTIERGPLRRSQVELLLGESGEVRHKENGVTFSFDVTEIMFSSGNVSERIRMAHLNAAGEVILDLFAGIGYYTLPLLVHAEVNHVFACELNPVSARSLRQNLDINGVSQRCTVLEGDNRDTTSSDGIVGEVDRALLGLLPDSSLAWATALTALKPSGGMLHLHGNAISGDQQEWAEQVIDELGLISTAQGLERGFQLEHIEVVKSYAPRVVHCVLDIRVE